MQIIIYKWKIRMRLKCLLKHLCHLMNDGKASNLSRLMTFVWHFEWMPNVLVFRCESTLRTQPTSMLIIHGMRTLSFMPFNVKKTNKKKSFARL